MIGGCIYLISLVLGISGIFLVQKKSEALNAVCYLSVSVTTFMCYQALTGSILHLFGLDVSGKTVGMANFLLIFICFIHIIRGRSIQKYKISVYDIVMVCVLASIVLGLGMHQFGRDLSLFNYQSTVDSSRHLNFAREVALHHTINSIPFMAINTGLIFEALGHFMEPYMDYRIIILTDVFMLFLAGIMFWSLIRRILADRFLLFAGMVITVFYMMGYPLNNMVFGTSYLGSATTVAILIFFAIDRFRAGEISRKYFIFSMLTALTGLLRSYPQFFPIILVSVLVYFLLKYMQVENMVNKNISLIALSFLCAACFVSICFILQNISPESYVLRVLGMEGYMYNSLFGDFIFLIPFIFYRIYKCYKSRELSFDFTVCLFVLSYIGAFLYGNYIGRVSTYYYFKNYYLLWLIVFYILAIDIAECEKGKRDVVTVYCISILSLFGFIFSGLESKLEQKSIENGKNLNWELQAPMVFRIFSWNFEFGDTNKMSISPELRDLYFSAAKLSDGPDDVIPYVGYYDVENFSYYALARQWEPADDYPYYYWNPESFIENSKKYVSYICRVYDSRPDIGEQLENYLSSLPVEFQNEAGCIYRIQ